MLYQIRKKSIGNIRKNHTDEMCSAPRKALSHYIRLITMLSGAGRHAFPYLRVHSLVSIQHTGNRRLGYTGQFCDFGHCNHKSLRHWILEIFETNRTAFFIRSLRCEYVFTSSVTILQRLCVPCQLWNVNKFKRVFLCKLTKIHPYKNRLNKLQTFRCGSLI